MGRCGEDAHELRERVATPAAFRRLRAAAGTTSRSREGIEVGLPNSTYGVMVVCVPSDGTAGMGRVVSDDATVYHVCDVAVAPAPQRRGLGTRIVDALLGYVEETAPPDAYVNLLADVDGFYEQWWFEETRPASRAMYARPD